MKKSDQWGALFERLVRAAYSILESAKTSNNTKRAADPRVLSCALLSRTISNATGVVGLLDAGLVVEGRILTRCCFENQFYIAGLLSEGDRFVGRMRDDEIKNHDSRIQFVFKTESLRTALDADREAKLGAWLKENRSKWPDARTLTPKAVAEATVVKSAYLAYSHLSSDAGHPSVHALSRYVTKDNDLVEIVVAPDPTANEIEETYNFLCMAFLGACVGVNQLLGYPLSGSVLESLGEEYGSLSGTDQAGKS
jgi:hypothetical protein